MKIDGSHIAKEITDELKVKVQQLNSENIFPKLAIVTLGQEDAWSTYVRQKIKLGDRLGVTTELINLTRTTDYELINLVELLDRNPAIHGIIVQCPMPEDIDNARIINAISPKKDIDGFRSDSAYEVPVFLAVKRVLEEAKKVDFSEWLKTQNIVVIGKGQTAGAPIAEGLKKLGADVKVVGSKTESREFVIKSADVIVSAVGKRILATKDLKSGVVLVGVGLFRDENGKLQGDYDEAEIKNVASFYTPTPGGIGPINLAYLFQNLISAAQKNL